jgi:hypothetical protein
MAYVIATGNFKGAKTASKRIPYLDSRVVWLT